MGILTETKPATAIATCSDMIKTSVFQMFLDYFCTHSKQPLFVFLSRKRLVRQSGCLEREFYACLSKQREAGDVWVGVCGSGGRRGVGGGGGGAEEAYLQTII